jgi:hypothetical protein
MLKNGGFRQLKTWYHYLIALTVVQVFFCVQFDNPVDPAFKGAYDFKVDNFKSSSVLSIFQPYALDINDSLGKNKYLTFSCYTKIDSVAYVTKIDSNTFQVVFYKPCTTDIVVKGIHPNGNIDERKFENVEVLNPYLIGGRDTIAKNDTIELFVNKIGAGKDTSLKVQWSNETRDTTGNSFFIQRDNTQSDSTLIKATLFYDNSTNYTINKRITFRGWSPRIRAINIKSFNPNDTGMFISQTDSFKVKMVFDDPDTNTLKLEILVDTTRFVKSAKIRDSCSMTLPPIKDPRVDSILVRIVDNMGYTADSSLKIKVQPFPPRVVIKDTIQVAFNNSYNFFVESSVNSTGFNWELFTSKDTTKGTSEFSNWVIGPFVTEGTYTLHVTPVNKYNTDPNKFGQKKTCVIIAKNFKYQTFFKDHENNPDVVVKVNKPCTLNVAISKGDTIINDIGLKYSWDTSAVAGNIILNNSWAILTLKDSVEPFWISVKGIVNGEGAQDAQIRVDVRYYRPQFIFSDTSYKSSVDSVVHLKYKATPNNVDSTPVLAVYYRIPALGDSAIKYDSASGIRFNSIGKYIVEMWCVDRDSIQSLPDADTVKVFSNLPLINLKSRIIEVAINQSIKIKGIQATSNETGVPIDSILWDFNNDGTFDKSEKVNANNTVEIELNASQQPKMDSITIACKDKAGNVSISVRQYINVFSDVPKIDSCGLLTGLTKYKIVPVDFKISITDPDDSLLFLKVFANGVVFDSLSSVGKQDIVSLKFDSPGTYRIQFVVVDIRKNHSDTLSLTDLLVINPGTPVITAFNIKDSLTFIKDTIRCIPVGTDYNGTIKKYLYYINDTNSNPVDLVGDTLKYAFADSGKYVIYTRIIDNDTLSSAFAADTVVVRRGQPVVEKFKPDTSSIFVKDSMSFSITVSDSNGRVIKREIIWNEKIIDTTKYVVGDTLKKVGLSFSVADAGLNIFKMRVLDDDSIYSEWKACSLYVKKGVPSIAKMLANRDTSRLFIKDLVVFTIMVSDSNSNADSVYLLINSIPIKGVKLDSMICNISYTFQKVDTTLSQVNFKVIDKTEFSSISSFPVHISSGAPKVDNVNITGPTGSTFYVNDSIRFRVNVSDNNGVPKQIKASWNNEFSPVESLNVIAGGSQSLGYVEFTHKYDTTHAGNKTVRFWVDDNDTVLSAPDARTITMHMGAPAIWGNSGDTIWVPVKQGYGDYYYKPNYIDTNGTIDTFYFGLTDNISQAAKGIVDNAKITVEQATSHNGTVIRYIWGKDDDGIIRGGRFVVYADSAPPVPALGNVTIQGDSVKLVWEKSDFKDGDLTLFQIQCDTNNSPVTIVKAFGTCRKSGTEFYYWYHPPLSGRYRWKITAKDARGSIAESVGTPYFDFVKP